MASFIGLLLLCFCAFVLFVPLVALLVASWLVALRSRDVIEG